MCRPDGFLQLPVLPYDLMSLWYVSCYYSDTVTHPSCPEQYIKQNESLHLCIRHIMHTHYALYFPT